MYIHPKNPNLIIENILSIPPVGQGIAFWFVQMIIVVYLIIMIINYLNKYNKVFLKAGLIVSILFLFLLNFNIIPHYSFPLSYIYYSVYGIFGYYLAYYDFSDIKFITISKEMLCILFFALSIILYILEIYFNATNSLMINKYTSINQFGFLNVSLVISVFLFFRYFTQSEGNFNKIYKYIMKNKIGDAILSISFCSYGIYLCQGIIFHLLVDLLYFSESIFSSSIYYTLVLIFTLLISWLLILTIDKIPFLNNFSGRYQQ